MPEQPIEDLLEDTECILRPVDTRYYREYLGYTRWYYSGDAFRAWQCFWPGKRDRVFAWDEGRRGRGPRLVRDGGRRRPERGLLLRGGRAVTPAGLRPGGTSALGSPLASGRCAAGALRDAALRNQHDLTTATAATILGSGIATVNCPIVSVL